MKNLLNIKKIVVLVITILFVFQSQLNAQVKSNSGFQKPKTNNNTSGTKPILLQKSGTTTTKFDPNKAYKPNPNLMNLINYPPQSKTIDGVKISSRMAPIDSKQSSKQNGFSEKNTGTTAKDENGMHCVYQTTKVSASSENFDVPYSTAASHIYPGAVYKYEDYYSDNVNPTEITWSRNPMYIQIDASSGNGKYQLVENPSRTTLVATTGELKKTLTGPPTNASTSISVVSIHNQADFAFKVSASGGGWGFKAKAGFGISNSSSKSYFMIDATQALYTMNAYLPPTDSITSFFKDPNNDKNNSLLFMSSVTYGRRVIGIIETEFESNEQFADFQASYSAGVGNASVGLEVLNKMSQSKTTVKLLLIGGQASVIEIPDATKESVLAKINNYMKSMTWQNAVPINFSFRNMKMQGMRYENATDNFTTKQCTPIKGDLPYNVTVTLTSIQNITNFGENINFGALQNVNLNVAGNNIPFKEQQIKILKDPVTGKEFNTIIPKFLYWGENNSEASKKYGNPDENPRSFKETSQVNKSLSIQLLQKDIVDKNAYIQIHTPHVCMYGFSDNSDFYGDKYIKKIFLKDIIGQSTSTSTIDINHSQGRTFRFTYQISLTPNTTK